MRSRLPISDSLGSIGGVSTMRADTPVNSGGPERMELMATLSRISHIPIHNSFMPVDNPLYLDHTGYEGDWEKPVKSTSKLRLRCLVAYVCLCLRIKLGTEETTICVLAS